MTKKQHIGSHNNHARPDEKMGHARIKSPRRDMVRSESSSYNKAAQRVASAKRRRRDKREGGET